MFLIFFKKKKHFESTETGRLVFDFSALHGIAGGSRGGKLLLVVFEVLERALLINEEHVHALQVLDLHLL